MSVEAAGVGGTTDGAGPQGPDNAPSAAPEPAESAGTEGTDVFTTATATATTIIFSGGGGCREIQAVKSLRC